MLDESQPHGFTDGVGGRIPEGVSVLDPGRGEAALRTASEFHSRPAQTLTKGIESLAFPNSFQHFVKVGDVRDTRDSVPRFSVLLSLAAVHRILPRRSGHPSHAISLILSSIRMPNRNVKLLYLSRRDTAALLFGLGRDSCP